MENKVFKQCPICASTKVKYERTYHGHDLVKCELCDFVYATLSDKELVCQLLSVPDTIAFHCCFLQNLSYQRNRWCLIL